MRAGSRRSGAALGPARTLEALGASGVLGTLGVVGGVLLAGCAPHPIYLVAEGPQPVDDALAYLDLLTQSVILVDPDGGAGEEPRRRVRRVHAGTHPVSLASYPRPDAPTRRQAVVADPAGQQFLIVRDAAGTTDAIELGLPLEALAVSADGRYGLAYAPADADVSGSLFAFPNTVAIVDLHPDSPGATTLQLGTGGARPLAAVFSEPLQIERNLGGSTVVESGRIALVFVRGGIIAIDAQRAEAGPFLALTPNDDREVKPAEVLFTNNRGDAIRGFVDGVERAFVRTSTGEVYVLAIGYAGARLSVALENVITPDAAVRDIELFFNEDGNSLILAVAGDDLILVDGFSGVAERFDSPVPVDRLVRYDDPETGAARALAYRQQNPQDLLLQIDPLRLQERRSTAIRSLLLGSRVAGVEVGSGAVRAVLRYTDSRDLGVLDLRAAHGNEVLDLRFATEPLAQALVDDGARLLVVAHDEAPHLVEVHLDGALGTGEVTLDEAGYGVGRIGDWIWVDHRLPSGGVTFFPHDRLDRTEAVTFRGFSMFDVLQEPAPF